MAAGHRRGGRPWIHRAEVLGRTGRQVQQPVVGVDGGLAPGLKDEGPGAVGVVEVERRVANRQELHASVAARDRPVSAAGAEREHRQADGEGAARPAARRTRQTLAAPRHRRPAMIARPRQSNRIRPRRRTGHEGSSDWRWPRLSRARLRRRRGRPPARPCWSSSTPRRGAAPAHPPRDSCATCRAAGSGRTRSWRSPSTSTTGITSDGPTRSRAGLHRPTGLVRRFGPAARAGRRPARSPASTRRR